MNRYRKHQAFNHAYQLITTTNQEVELTGFDAASEYHHDPDKLKEENLKNYRAYFKWSVELYKSCNEIEEGLRTIYHRAEKASNSFYSLNTERVIAKILKDLLGFQQDVHDLREDIHEFQTCILLTEIFEKQTQIQVLSEKLNYLSLLEEKIISICDRKQNEISTNRMSFYSLTVSISALIIALISISLK